MTTFVMGIDGGGSTVRVAIVSLDLTRHGQSEGFASVNPNVVGEEQARFGIQAAINDALHNAKLPAEQIAAIGVGIAGASAEHSAHWLRRVVNKVMPSREKRRRRLVLSSDYEIALVGAHGERRGILILAGTGSLAYGVSATGESALVGGLGYLLGDEGGGYWLGLAALRAAIRHFDGRGPRTSLTDALLPTHHLENRTELIDWVYSEPRNRQIAGFAPVLLEQAALGDRVAREIVEQGAAELALAARTVMHRLKMERLPIAFAGSLLSTANPLSTALCGKLGLETFPVPRHPPVIGAAILALQLVETTES